MSSRLHKLFGAAAMAALLVLPAQVLAQSDDADAEMRIQRLEKAGVILKRVALVSPEAIGVGLRVRALVLAESVTASILSSIER